MSYKRMTLALLLVVVFGVAAFAQEARVKVKVHPPEAYVFLDGTPIGNNTRDVFMTPGKHTIGVYNYGYAPQVQEIDAKPGKNPEMSFSLVPKGEAVKGPFGALQIEGGGRNAVLVNGKTPDYFVGHGDEFNNHIFWSQQLILPPGTHQVTVTWRGTELFSGPVTIEPNMRTILWLHKGGKTEMQPWPDAGKPIARPRFDAGAASAQVVVAPPSGQFTATPGQIFCNDPAKLAWSSLETVDATMTADAAAKPVPAAQGDETVSPRKTTTYNFAAVGPGGWVKQSQTVAVDPTIQSSLTSAKPEVTYLKVGEQVLVNEKTELNWTTAHADAVTLQPVGNVNVNGNTEVAPVPEKMQIGKVDETKTYTLASTNVCGGSDSKTANVHLGGLIETNLVSIFFPTGYPDRRHPDLGLVASQQKELERVAEIFRIYLQHTPEAKLMIAGYTDPRDTTKANLKLSERRANRVKDYLVAQGIAADKIEIQFFGKSKPLDKTMVAELDAQHPALPEAKLSSNPRTRWLAYNRRVDIVMQPADLQSLRLYPHEAIDAKVLWQAPWPSLKEVQQVR
ncbi:MAG TPA: OmpA family protein [Terriglobales bacterium]|nr:OmpA family protein [Terriglobales bacterium]